MYRNIYVYIDIYVDYVIYGNVIAIMNYIIILLCDIRKIRLIDDHSKVVVVVGDYRKNQRNNQNSGFVLMSKIE